jgi:3-methylfumaryl-CoA hydratase
MGDVANETLQQWIGRTRTERDEVSLFPARGLAALLDDDALDIRPGAKLQDGWHWLYFKPTIPQSAIGPDGHEQRGSFLPPVALPRRMWAGGRLRFRAPLHLGDVVERVSTITDIVQKDGRSGPLVFVTVHHVVSNATGFACDEEQHIVYRDAPVAPVQTANARRLEESARWFEEFTPDRVALFRFSALTFNGHRIHYDQPYAIAEGYPDIVVHGPLLALLLLRAARRNAEGCELTEFEYRAVAPLFAGQTIRIHAEEAEADTVRLWATDQAGVIAMEATARR